MAIELNVFHRIGWIETYMHVLLTNKEREEKNIYPSEDIIRWKDNILYIELEKWYMREGKRKEKNNKIYKSGGEHQQQEPSQALDDIVMSS